MLCSHVVYTSWNTPQSAKPQTSCVWMVVKVYCEHVNKRVSNRKMFIWLTHSAICWSIQWEGSTVKLVDRQGEAWKTMGWSQTSDGKFPRLPAPYKSRPGLTAYELYSWMVIVYTGNCGTGTRNPAKVSSFPVVSSFKTACNEDKMICRRHQTMNLCGPQYIQ